MALHPEVQAKAQAELDRVVGPDRLPQVADRDSLPYIAAVMREVFRWQPIVPVGTSSPALFISLRFNRIKSKREVTQSRMRQRTPMSTVDTTFQREPW